MSEKLKEFYAKLYPGGEKKCAHCGRLNKEGEGFRYHIFKGEHCPECDSHIKRLKAIEKREEIRSGDHDTDCEDEITCPYCGYEFSDSFEYQDGWQEELGDIDCPDCKETFECTASFSVSYSTKKKDPDE